MDGSDESKSLTRQTLHSLAWMFSGSWLRGVLRVAVLAVLARLLLPEDFGTVQAAQIVIGFAEAFAQFGVGTALIQFPTLTKAHVRTSLTLTVGLALVLAGVVWAGADLIAAFFEAERVAPVVRILCVVFPISALGVLSENLMRRTLKYQRLAIVEVVAYLVGYGGVGIGMALAGYGLYSLVGAILAMYTTRSLVLYAMHPYPLAFGFDGEALRSLAHFGGGVTLSGFLNYIALSGDNLVVGRTLGVSALGLYGRAYNTMNASVGLFGSVLDKVLFSAMSRKQEDVARLREVYVLGININALFIVPVGFLAAILAPEIVAVLLGPDWTGVIVPFQVLCIGMVFRVGYKISDSTVRSLGKVYRIAVHQLIYAVLIIGLAYVGHHWGLFGTSVGVVVALLIHYSLMIATVSRITGRGVSGPVLAGHAAIYGVSGAISGVIWLAVAHVRTLSGVLALAPLVGVVVALVGYGLAAWLVYPRLLRGEWTWLRETLRPMLAPVLARLRVKA